MRNDDISNIFELKNSPLFYLLTCDSIFVNINFRIDKDQKWEFTEQKKQKKISFPLYASLLGEILKQMVSPLECTLRFRIQG